MKFLQLLGDFHHEWPLARTTGKVTYPICVNLNRFELLQQAQEKDVN